MPKRDLYHYLDPRTTALTYHDVALHLKVHEDTVRRWVRDEKLTALRLGENLVRILPEDLDVFLARRGTIEAKRS